MVLPCVNVLTNVLRFVEGLSRWSGCIPQLRSMLVRVLAIVDGAQNVASMESPRSLTQCPHLPLSVSPLWTRWRSLTARGNRLRLDPVYRMVLASEVVGPRTYPSFLKL